MMVYITPEEHKNLCELFNINYEPIDFEPIQTQRMGRSAFKGLHHTKESKQELRKHNLGKNNPMFGLTGEKNHFYGKQKEKVICPHCSKSGGKNVMVRWHFNNCRLNKLTQK
jgi:hypothetical protein